MKRFLKTLGFVVLRELKIIRVRPIFLLASVAVLAFNAFFYTTFLRDGLPHDMPVGVVDMDHTSTSRNFAINLDAMQLTKVIYYDDHRVAQSDMQRGRIMGYVVIPEHFNAEIQAQRRPTLPFYVNSLYFVGGALSYKALMQMTITTNGAVERQILRMKGVNDREIMGRIQPIVLDQHQIGNVTTNYGVYLNNVILPGILEMIVILLIIYAVGQELKYGTSKHLLKKTRGNMEIAMLGKLIPYTLIFLVLGFSLVFFLYHWMHYPMAGSIWHMGIAITALVLASEAAALFIISMVPTLRLAISVGAIYSILGLTMAGFTLPLDGMPEVIRPLANIFPLRHYYLFYVQEGIYGAGFAAWWPYLIYMLVFLFLPALGFKRLRHAYTYLDYPRN